MAVVYTVNQLCKISRMRIRPIAFTASPDEHYVYRGDARCVICSVAAEGELPVGSGNIPWLE